MRLRALSAAVCVILLGVAAPVAAQAPLEPLDGQWRLTTQGGDGDPAVDARAPALAYNTRNDEHLLVWSGQSSTSPRDEEIYVRHLDAAGRPLGEAERRTSVGVADDPTIYARDPVAAFDSVHNRYAIAYVTNVDAAIPGSQSDIFIRLVDAQGQPVGEPRRVSSAVAGRALEPDIVHHAADDRFMVVWREDPGSSEDLAHVWGRLVNADTGEPEGEGPEQISSSTSGVPGAASPAVALRPVNASFAVAWLGSVPNTSAPSPGTPYKREIWARAVQRDGSPSSENPQQLTQTGPIGAPEAAPSAPDLAANSDRSEMLLTFSAPADPEDGEEIYAQRLAPDLVPLGTPRAISAAGPFGSRSGYRAHLPAVSYHRSWKSYLVTWSGTDDGRLGLSDAEFEVMGQVLDGTGAQVGKDDFVISRLGLDGAGNSGPGEEPAAIAVGERSGRWLVAWAGDDARPPTADGELEIWGRQVGPNLDRDYDGSPMPQDCDDLDPRRRPGQPDIADNGVDEDCSGTDNLDSDGDGSARPKDCNDSNPFVHPRRRDIPGNGIDEDCSGRDALLPTAAKVRVAWLYGATSTAARVLVERVRRGMRVRMSCRGRGCPIRLARRARTIRVWRGGTLRLTRHLRGARLQPGALVEIRVLDPRALGVLERYRVRRGQPPTHRTRCLRPSRSQPTRCRA